MNGTEFYAYIRVSTAKQGEKGVSLIEQKAAIERYAERNSYTIVEWFEERETAASRGRPVFNRMLQLLRKRKVRGVLIHKIDRSARNLKDWADLGELIDQGIEVHFANEGLDLHSRGGRLSADIQAVVAADYIRNLREESIKGLYGRLKQGIYPFSAPIGYQNNGGGKVKTIDPVTGPLVRQMFELYATGKYPLHRLRHEMAARGLRGIVGSELSLNGVSVILRNPFYMGIIRIRRNGQTYAGVHEPLITPALFATVEAVRMGKVPHRTTRHAYSFRKLIRCGLCDHALIGESQKGRIYYRCQTKACPTKTIREDRIELAAAELFARMELPAEVARILREKLEGSREDVNRKRKDEQVAMMLQLQNNKERLHRLTDAYLDRIVDEPVYRERRESLLMEQKRVEERLGELNQHSDAAAERTRKFLELAESLKSSYAGANSEEKRVLIEMFTSNRALNQRKLVLEPVFEYVTSESETSLPDGAPDRCVDRNQEGILAELINFFRHHEFVWPLKSTDAQLNKKS